MSNFKFYAVIAANAVAVFSSWEKYQAATKYLRKPSCKSFETFAEAEDWAFFLFSDRFPRLDPPLKMTPNFVYYTKDLQPDFY